MTALAWDGCLNVRDLGGLPTEDGRTTRFHRVVRSDNIGSLSDEGWSALVDYGVRRIVDLRFPEELVDDTPRDVPVEVVHVSLLGERRSEAWLAEEFAAMDRATETSGYLVWSYSGSLERFRDRFAAALGAVAAGPDGPVLVHCMGGKDRTGLVSALTLRAAGVPVEAVAADYALTEAALAPVLEEWIDAAADEDDRRRRILLGPAPAGAMADVLRGLDERYGGVAAYLRGGGLGEEALRSLEERLVAA